MAFDYIQKLYEEVGKYEILENKNNPIELKRKNETYRILNQYFKGKNILEIGPASGYISEIINKFAEENNIKFDILDFSDSYKSTTEKRDLNINQFYIGDINDSNFNLNRKYDFILLQEVIEHTVSPYTTLVNIFNHLNDEGYLYITLPNSNYYRSLLAASYWSVKGFKEYKDTHIAEISPTGMYKLLTMSGYNIENMKFYGFPYFQRTIAMFFSYQVGFLCLKNKAQNKVWSELTEEHIEIWKKRNENKIKR